MGCGGADGTNLQFGGWGHAQPILDKWLQLRYSLVMAVIPAVNREIDMQTKSFTNMFGREVEVSREKFIERWTDEAFKFTTLFWANHVSGNDQRIYSEFVEQVEKLAGEAWDSK
jgi:hypothetical protein